MQHKKGYLKWFEDIKIESENDKSRNAYGKKRERARRK